jgi:RNA polymerase sigma factor for flagellar operon FliA
MMQEQALEEKATIQRYSSLVRRIAQNLLMRLPASVQVDDLMQAGMMGLLEAAKNFNANKGASFETYAGIRIRGSMLDEIRKGDWVPRSVHRNTRRIAAAVKIIENLTGRDARDIEVAQELELTIEEYHRMLQASNNTRIYAFEEIGLKDDLMSEGLTTCSNPLMGPLDCLQRADFQKNLSKGISTLPERDRLVLTLYYEEELNLRQVGEVLGVSESRVSQIHSQAMHRLQTRLKAWSV